MQEADFFVGGVMKRDGQKKAKKGGVTFDNNVVDNKKENSAVKSSFVRRQSALNFNINQL